jgi:hypothetical protein
MELFRDRSHWKVTRLQGAPTLEETNAVLIETHLVTKIRGYYKMMPPF